MGITSSISTGCFLPVALLSLNHGRQNSIKLLPHDSKVLTSRGSDKCPWCAQERAQELPPGSHLFPWAVAEPCPCRDVPLALPGCRRANRAAARSQGHEQRLVRSRRGELEPRSAARTLPEQDSPPARPCLTPRSAGSALRRATHLILLLLLLREFPGGFGAEESMARWRGTALPFSQRSAVRVICVRRFASVSAAPCVRVWSCLAFSMQVTPSRACSRSPHPGRQNLPASEPSSPPSSPSSPLQHSAEFLSSLISRVLCVVCVCVCVPMHIVFSLSFFPPLTACFARWLKFASQ